MHGVLEEFLVIFAHFPLIFFHQLAVLVERIRIVVLRISFEEFATFALGLFDDFGSKFARQTSGFPQNHIPNIIGNHSPTVFAFLHSHHIHHGKVLHILAERSHQRRITDTRPYIGNFVEQLNQKLVLRHKRQIMLCLIFVDRFQIRFEVCH